MGQRLELHKVLVDILGDSTAVYFQPPASLKMHYPCIVYSRDNLYTRFADDNLYLGKTRYQVTVIDTDPDSPIPDKVARLQFSTFDRAYTEDMLYHDSYNVYF